MSKDTIKYISIGTTVLFAVVAIWQFMSIQSLDAVQEEETIPTDYDQLERVVSLWEEREDFSFTPSTDQLPESDDTSDTDQETIIGEQIQISVQNGSGVAGAADAMADRLSEISGVEIASITNADEADATVVSHKSTVDSTLVTEIVLAVEEEYGEVATSSLPGSSVFDVVVILGGE